MVQGMVKLIFRIMTFDLLIFIFFKSDILIYFLHLKNCIWKMKFFILIWNLVNYRR